MPRYFNFFGRQFGFGSREDDIFQGSSRNDFYFGGRGTDTVVMSGDVRDAAIDSFGRGLVRVTTDTGGTDLLFGMERLQFGNYTVNLDGTNNAVLAEGDVNSGREDTAISGSFADLIANDYDYDYDGDGLTVTNVTSLSGGTVTLTSDGYTFVPAANFNGDATLEYTVTDGNGSTTTGIIVVSVAAVNDGPVAGDDTVSVDASQEIVLDTDLLLANDTDVDGDALSIVGILNVTGGIAELVNGTITFTADGQAVDGVPVSLDYTISDGQGGFDTATVTFDVDYGVNPVANLAPVADDETYTAGFSSPFVAVTADQIIGDSFDPEGGSLTLLSLVGTSGFSQVITEIDGTFLLAATGTFEPATYEFTIQDEFGLIDTGIISILTPDFGPPPPPPPGEGSAQDDFFDFFSTSADSAPFTFTIADLLGNDGSSADLTFVGFEANALTDTLPSFVDGIFTVEPTGEFATTSFDYTVADAEGVLSTATVTISELSVLG